MPPERPAPTAGPAPPAPPCRFSALLGEAPAAVARPAPLPAGPLTPRASPGTVGRAAEATLTRLFDGDRRVDGALARMLRGGPTTPGQLLALQANVMRHAQELELASRLVDKLTGAVKQTLQTQV